MSVTLSITVWRYLVLAGNSRTPCWHTPRGLSLDCKVSCVTPGRALLESVSLQAILDTCYSGILLNLEYYDRHCFMHGCSQSDAALKPWVVRDNLHLRLSTDRHTGADLRFSKHFQWEDVGRHRRGRQRNDCSTCIRLPQVMDPMFTTWSIRNWSRYWVCLDRSSCDDLLKSRREKSIYPRRGHGPAVEVGACISWSDDVDNMYFVGRAFQSWRSSADRRQGLSSRLSSKIYRLER